MIRVLIADDEAHARERLKTLLEEYKGFTVVKEIDDGDKLISALIEQKIDVAFLDINMPGLDIFKTLSSLKTLPLIVFQTAYSEYAVKAFEIQALDYIMKPVSRERFSACIEKINHAINSNKTPESETLANKKDTDNKTRHISVRSGNKIRVIKIEEIIKFEVEDSLCFIYTKDGRFLADKSLNYFETLLSEGDFFRISRTAIINLNDVKHLHPMFKGNYVVELNNQMKLPVSRRRMKELREKISFL